MLDSEIARLRRLRGAALRLRALARSLGSREGSPDDILLERSACAAWRIARTVSGRLRAHPFADFQRDAGLGLLLRNAVSVKLLTAVSTRDRHDKLKAFDRQLKIVTRQLDDSRALAWDGDLSDSLGRSQVELRILAMMTRSAVSGAFQGLAPRPADCEPTPTDWPFVAL